MPYTKNYTGPKADRMRSAYNDALIYLGAERFAKLCNAMYDVLEATGNVRNFVITYPFYMSLAGLHGAPARAIALRTIRLWNKINQENLSC